MLLTPSAICALDLAKGQPVTPNNLSRVSKEVGEELTRWAFQQWALREKARQKFERADEMLFVAEALEQATHPAVAAWRAQQFPSGASVADITCGIGADLIALAQHGCSVTGLDLDSDRADAARHNLEVHGLTGDVQTGDGLAADGFDYIIADPARRMDGRRTLDINEFQPNPIEIAERFGDTKRLAIKLTPMLADDLLLGFQGRVDFVSYGAECREACIWLGTEVQPGWGAVHVESGSRIEVGLTPIGLDASTVAEPGQFLHHLDPAAIRAHAGPVLAEQYGLTQLGDAPAYWVGAECIHSPWLRPYEILADQGADTKKLKATLRALDARVVEIKVSGPKIDAKRLQTDIQATGSRALSLCVWGVGKSVRYTLVERVATR